MLLWVIFQAFRFFASSWRRQQGPQGPQGPEGPVADLSDIEADIAQLQAQIVAMQQVPDVRGYDQFYQRLIALVPHVDVSASFVMETLQETTRLPLKGAL